VTPVTGSGYFRNTWVMPHSTPLPNTEKSQGRSSKSGTASSGVERRSKVERRYPRASPWYFITQASLDLNAGYTHMKNLNLIHTLYFMRAFRKLHSPTGKPVELCPSGY